MLAPISTTNGAFLTPRSRSPGLPSSRSLVERLLHVGGKFARFVDLVLEGNFLYQVRELVDGFVGDSIFTGSYFQRIGRGGEVEVIGLDSACRRVGTGVGVNGKEEIGLRLVGDGRSGLQRNEGVVIAGKDDVGAQALLEQLAQAQRDIEHHLLFFNATRSHGAGVMSTMAGIDDDAADLETECAHQGALAGRGRIGLVRGRRENCRRSPQGSGGARVEGAWLLAAAAGTGGGATEAAVVEASEPSSGCGAGTVPATEAAMGRVVGWSVA